MGDAVAGKLVDQRIVGLVRQIVVVLYARRSRKSGGPCVTYAGVTLLYPM